MYKLRKILTLVFLPLFLAGCGSGGEGSDAELQIEVDCSNPVLTSTEPLPPGDHPESWTTKGNSYWDCDGEKEYYNADGTFTGRFADTFTRSEEYDLLVTIWRACRIGTRPPEVAGSWVVVDDTICIRADTAPGIIGCIDIFSEPDGRSFTVGGNLETIQYGRVVDSSYEGAETCYLEDE